MALTKGQLSFMDQLKEMALERWRVHKYAKEQGYRITRYTGVWNGYRVYEPGYGPIAVRYVGLPLYILVQDELIRMTTDEECMEILDAFSHNDGE